MKSCSSTSNNCVAVVARSEWLVKYLSDPAAWHTVLTTFDSVFTPTGTAANHVEPLGFFTGLR